MTRTIQEICRSRKRDRGVLSSVTARTRRATGGCAMIQVTSWVPEGLDISRPSAARMYDYLLGGGHNFEADRQLAVRVSRAHPGCWDLARLNRAFLRRAVLELGGVGVRQFLDIGSGIPTVGNVHEIAQRA